MKKNSRIDDIICRDVCKSFGGAIALDGANFTCNYGEIHALLGENGAGKSTLVKILSGAIKPDSGEILIDGRNSKLRSVREGIKKGIGAVYQELSLMPDLSVTENILFDREYSRFGLIDKKTNYKIIEELFKDYRLFGVSPDEIVGSLPISTQQIIEILKLFYRNPKILILDEATAALSREATIWLFDHLKKFCEKGASVLFISHRINEVIGIAQKITVFRNGKTVSTGLVKDYSESSLVIDMIGRKLIDDYKLVPPKLENEIALDINQLSLGDQFKKISFSVKTGEIFGLGGLQGQGQYEILLFLFGLFRSSGVIKLFGNEITINSPRDALNNGIALIPQDRRTEGLMMQQSIRENLVLPSLKEISKLNWIPIIKENSTANKIAEKFQIKAPNLEYEVQALSGGNQQKVLVGKILSENLKILLLADVSRGIDVGTRADVHKLINNLAKAGKTIILYSSESSELVRLCHRVAVMHDRTISTILEGENLTEERLIRAAFGFSSINHGN